MGRYIEWEEVVGRYSQINKIGGAESVGSDFIQYAEAEVDARLSCAYTTPFSEGVYTPMTVKDLAIDFTLLKATFGKEKAWDRLNKMLNERIEMICAGTIGLVLPDGTLLGQTGNAIWSSNQEYTPVFGMGDTLDFVVDVDRIEDEDDARL